VHVNKQHTTIDNDEHLNNGKKLKERERESKGVHARARIDSHKQ